MTRDEILSSTRLKEQFVRDNGLPITVLEKNLFLQRLIILDPVFGCRKAFDRYCQELLKYSDEHAYFRERELSFGAFIMNNIRTLEIMPHLRRFWNDNFYEQLGIANYLSIEPAEKFYSEENAGKTFARIRFRRGAFSAIHHYDPGLLKSDDLASFLNFADRHLAYSIEIQQRILEIFGRRRLTQLMAAYLSSAAFDLHSFFYGSPSACLDGELLYEVPPDALLTDETLDDYAKQIEQALLSLPHDLGSCFELEIFRLENLESLGFMEEYHRKKPVAVRFIDADPNLYHILLTYYFRHPLLNDDLVIDYNGIPARLVEPVPNPFRR